MEKETYSKPIVEIEKFRMFDMITTSIEENFGGDCDPPVFEEPGAGA